MVYGSVKKEGTYLVFNQEAVPTGSRNFSHEILICDERTFCTAVCRKVSAHCKTFYSEGI